MSIQVTPQLVTLYPNDVQLFEVSAEFPPPIWKPLGPLFGVLQPDFTVRKPFPADSTSVFAVAGYELAGGVGSIEFTLDPRCLPLSDAALVFRTFMKRPNNPAWRYEVQIRGAGELKFLDELGATLATIPFSITSGQKYRIEFAAGFRTFVDDVLVHSRTGLGGVVAYPASFWAQLSGATPPFVVGSPSVIPAYTLSGTWQLRPLITDTDTALDGTPLAIFSVEHGNLSAGGNPLQRKYSGGTLPGTYKLKASVDPGSFVYMEDAVPTGGTQATENGDAWTFVGSNPTPFSGSLCHKSNNVAGDHCHLFTGATDTMPVNKGDILYVYVFPDGTNTPTEIMIQWCATDASSCTHRAYWGANSISLGTDGTSTRRFMGSMPPTGQWTRLEVPAELVDMVGRVVNGMAFRLFGGVCSWDQAGKLPVLQSAEATINIPPLFIIGPTTITLQPGGKFRPQTNYDYTSTPPTWSVVIGEGSFSQGEFTAGTIGGTSLIRATVSGNQAADIRIDVPYVITPSYAYSAPSEVTDWEINIPAIPRFVSAGAVASGTGDVKPVLPVDLLLNDIMLLFVETANETVSTPSGWAAVADSPQGTGTAGGATSTALNVFWKRATDADVTAAQGGGTVTITDPGDHAIAQILLFRGVITTGNPWDVTSGDTGASSTSVTIPTDTTTVANCLIVLAVANATDDTLLQTSGYSNANLVNLTERTDVQTNSGNGGGFSVATGEKAAAGSYGATTATLATASVQGRISIALKPAAVTWTASAGSIVSTTGVWTAPSLLGQTVRITATDGTITVFRDVLIMEKFPFTNFAEMSIDYKSTSLISTAEDRTRVARSKDKDGLPFKSGEVRYSQRSVADLVTVQDFFKRNLFSKRFIFEDLRENVRIAAYFDSNIRYEGNKRCGIDISFRIVEA